jgi:hypothetical protein
MGGRREPAQGDHLPGAGPNGWRWVWRDVVAPLLLTRAGLLLVGWISQGLPRNPDFHHRLALGRGWVLTPWRLLDIWARWDSGWYLSIVRWGYGLSGRVETSQSNIAFFPLYPYTVKAIAMMLPGAARTDGALLAIGLLVSNACLLGGLLLVHRLVAASEGDEAVARGTVLLMLLFPTSFFFSCFFTEGMFLLLSAAALLAAQRRCWWAAGILGGLLALTRPNGVLLVVPLAFSYLASRGWRLRRAGADVAWLLLLPAGVLAYMAALLPVTGDLLAPFKIQAAWGKITSAPWDTLLDPRYPYPVTTDVERVVIIALLILAARSFWVLRDRSHALYAAVFLVAPLFTGVLNSQARYAAPLFPLFATMSRLSDRRRTRIVVCVLLAGLQIVAFAAWCQLYWIG